MVSVKIVFYANLKDKYCREDQEGAISITLEDGSRICDIFDRLHIDDREIGFIILNDQKVQKDAILNNGDTIHIFSFVPGG